MIHGSPAKNNNSLHLYARGRIRAVGWPGNPMTDIPARSGRPPQAAVRSPNLPGHSDWRGYMTPRRRLTSVCDQSSGRGTGFRQPTPSLGCGTTWQPTWQPQVGATIATRWTCQERYSNSGGQKGRTEERRGLSTLGRQRQHHLRRTTRGAAGRPRRPEHSWSRGVFTLRQRRIVAAEEGREDAQFREEVMCVMWK